METGIKKTQTLLLKRAQLASCRGNLGEAQIKSKSEAASTALVKSLRRKKKQFLGWELVQLSILRSQFRDSTKKKL